MGINTIAILSRSTLRPFGGHRIERIAIRVNGEVHPLPNPGFRLEDRSTDDALLVNGVPYECDHYLGKHRVDAGTTEWGSLYVRKAEAAPTAPALDHAPEEINETNNTTKTADNQINLTVRYQGRPPNPTQTFATGRLVRYSDGNGSNPPAHSMAEIRLWLREHGYQAEYERWHWLDRGAGPIRRLEVYTASDTTEAEPTDGGLRALAAAAGCLVPRLTDEERAHLLALAAKRHSADVDTLALQGHESNLTAMTDPWYRQNAGTQHDAAFVLARGGG